MDGKKLVVLGASNNIGREILKIIPEYNIPIAEILAVDVAEVEGEQLSYGESETLDIISHKKADYSNTDIVFVANKELYNASKSVFENSDTVLIDCIGFSVLNKEVPTVIPGINSSKLDLYDNKNVVLVPNCVTTAISLPVSLLDEKYGVKRVVASTYQAVSEKSMDAMNELYSHTKLIYQNNNQEPKEFVKEIPFNVIPMVGDQVDSELESDTLMYSEELKITEGVKEVFDNKISVSATCVTVPVFVGSAMSVNIELEKDFDLEGVVDTLESQGDIVVMDRYNENVFATPKDCIYDNSVYISRIRKDNSVAHGLNLWIVADNMRVGTVSNAVKVAELLINEHGI